MTGRVEPHCRTCGNPFDPEVVHDTFLANFLDRVGQPHSGRRPAWVRHFCSEACRYTDVRRRTDANNANMAARRAARRAAIRRENGR